MDFGDFCIERFITQNDPRVPLLKKVWNRAIESAIKSSGRNFPSMLRLDEEDAADFDQFLREEIIMSDDPRVSLLREAWSQSVETTIEWFNEPISNGVTLEDLKA